MRTVLRRLALLAPLPLTAALGACGAGEAPSPTPATHESPGPSAPAALEPAVVAEPRAPAYDHLVLVTFDTLRADHVASYGYRRATTPFLDQLARLGVQFDNALCSVSHTAPSHATMLTGLPPRVHGVRTNGNKLENSAASLPALLRPRGFASAAFLSAGFLRGIAGAFDKVHVGQGAPDLVDKALRWAAEQGERPYFLWLHLYEPHKWKRPKFPAWAREEVVASWSDEGGSAYDYLARLHGFRESPPGAPFDLAWSGGDGMGRQHRPESPDEVQQYIDDYDGLIRFADSHVRRLYEGLEPLSSHPGTHSSSTSSTKRKGLWMLTSDHGEGLGSHGYEGHGGRIYNEQLRVSLVFHATDDSLPARRVSELVAHLDLLPTLAELMGFAWAPPHPEFFGRSLVPLLDGSSRDFPARLIFAEQRPAAGESSDRGEIVAIQDLRHKLIRNPRGDEELYHLEEDPLELRDLAGADARLAELRAALEERLRYYAMLGGAEVEEPDPEFLEELRDLGYAR